jgi:hypothetical protein
MRVRRLTPPQRLASTDVTWRVARLEWPSGTLTALNDVSRSGDYSWCSVRGR